MFKVLAFIHDLRRLRRLSRQTKKRFALRASDLWMCTSENSPTTTFDRHYIYHPAWAARIVKEINPDVHVDISSSLYFCSMLSAFVPVDFYDYRPANLNLSGLRSSSADLLALPFKDNSVPSLSCMHTVEHVGLGRYGDILDYDGDVKAMKELVRVLAPKGTLLFVVPIGKEAIIQFNAHRIYTKEDIVGEFTKLGLTLREFSLIPDNESDGGIVVDPSTELLNRQKYGCGCFMFSKI